MEDLERLKKSLEKWQSEIEQVFANGGTIKIKKANDDFVLYKEILKKIK